MTPSTKPTTQTTVPFRQSLLKHQAMPSGVFGLERPDAADDDFTRFLEDQDVIAEQRRIYEQIVKEREPAMTVSDSMVRPRAIGRGTEGNTITTSHWCIHDELSTVDSAMCQQKKQLASRGPVARARRTHPDELCKLAARESGVSRHITQRDQTINVGSRRMTVKGTSHAYEAIANGTANLVQCACCSALLQVGSTAKMVYCVNCSHVTPIEVAKTRRDFVSGGHFDASIARSMQQNERDAALAQKLSALVGSSLLD